MTNDVTEAEIRAAMRNGIEASVVSDARWPRETYADACITGALTLVSVAMMITFADSDLAWGAMSASFSAGASAMGTLYLSLRTKRLNAHRERAIAAVREYARGDDP